MRFCCAIVLFCCFVMLFCLSFCYELNSVVLLFWLFSLVPAWCSVMRFCCAVRLFCFGLLNCYAVLSLSFTIVWLCFAVLPFCLSRPILNARTSHQSMLTDWIRAKKTNERLITFTLQDFSFSSPFSWTFEMLHFTAVSISSTRSIYTIQV